MMNRLVLALAFACAAGSAFAETPLERGAYLVNTIMTCGNCHTPMGPNGPELDKAFSGGLKFDEKPFTVHASNITPDKETGIGSWSAEELKALLVTGFRPNGMPVAPIMPYGFYRIMTPGDLDAVVAYIRSVPAVKNAVPAPEYRVMIPSASPPGTETPIDEAELKDPVRRGFYLATIGHCMECHTSRLPNGAPDYDGRLGAGGMSFPGPWGVSVSANITSDREKGLGAWTDAEIKRAITEGISRDGRKLKPPMGFGYYAKLDPADLDALVAYLRTVPARE